MSNGEPEKLYQLKCDHCGWKKFSDGGDESLQGMYEYKEQCQTCHGARVFRCQGCGFQVRLKRVLDLPQPPKIEKPKPIGYIAGKPEDKPPAKGVRRGR